MRRPLVSLLVLSLVMLTAAGTVQAPAAQPDLSDEPDNELLVPEKQGKLTLTLDPGAHTATIKKVFFTPDGQQVLTLSRDHSIRFWDVATGKTVRVLHVPGEGGLFHAALSRDGKRLAVASRYPDKEKVLYVIYVLALPEGRIERVLQGHSQEIDALAMSPDGKLLASASREPEQKKVRFPLRLWNLDSDEPARVLWRKGKVTQSLAFSPDGRRLARLANTPSMGEIIDLASEQGVGKLTGNSVVWSPDGKTLATRQHENGGVNLCDETGQKLRTVPSLLTHALAFSADSRTLLVTSGRSHQAELFEVATGKSLARFQQKVVGAAVDGAFSPDGRWAVTGGGTIRHNAFIWDTQDVRIFKHLQAPVWLAPGRPPWSADGKSVVFSGRNNAASFHLGELEFRPPLAEKDVRALPRLQQGALSLKGTEVPGHYPSWEVIKDGAPFAKLPWGGLATLVGKEGTWAALAKGFTLTLIDVRTGTVVRRFEGHRGLIRGIAPSPDGRLLLSIGEDQLLRLWNPEREQPLLTMYVYGDPLLRQGRLPANDWIVWTPEGYYAATPGGERMLGWKVDNGLKQLPTFYPAERFRKQLYRPDVIRLLLEKGNLKDALKTANAALPPEDKVGRAAIADPNQLLPPRATLQILERSALPRVKVKASAVAAAPAQPVVGLRLFVDGRPLPEGAGISEGKAPAVWDIVLPPGKHTLKVQALSPGASAFSEGEEIDAGLPVQGATLHVLAIGVNTYKDPRLTLKFAAPDAQAIADVFSKHCQGALFPNVSTGVLVNQQADRDAIRKQLKALRQKVGRNDLAVVFFAGHGIKDKDNFYLLPVGVDVAKLEDTAISGKELRKELAEFSCQVLLLLDACHASAGVKAFRPAVDDLTRALTDDDVGVAVFCAAMGNEEAEESKGNGLFTRKVVEALSRRERVPYNYHDQRQYIHHLHSYVFDEVQRVSGDRQHPFLCLPWIVTSFPLREVPSTERATP